MAQKEDWGLHEAKICTRLGLLRSRAGDFQQGISLLTRAAEIFQGRGEVSGHAWTLNRIGILYLERSQNGQSKAYFHQSLQLLRSIGAAYQSAVISNLAVIYHQEVDYDRARSLYQEALVDMIATERWYEVGLTESNLGELELLVGNMRAAELHLNNGQAAAKRIRSSYLLSLLAPAMSGLRLLQGHVEQSIQIATEGVQFAKQSDAIRIEADNLAQLGASLHRKGLLEEAKQRLTEALEKVEIHGHMELMAIILARRGAVLLALGDQGSAAADFNRAKLDPQLATAVKMYQGTPHTPKTFEERLAHDLQHR